MFAPIYDAHFPLIFGFIYKRVRDRETCADLTSLVFLKALHGLQRFTWNGIPFSAWLMRIAINEVNAHYRRSVRHSTIAISEADIENLRAELTEDSQTDDTVLINALNRATEEDRTVIELRFFESRTFEEMGLLLNVPTDTAKMRTYRAIGRLRDLMRKMESR